MVPASSLQIIGRLWNSGASQTVRYVGFVDAALTSRSSTTDRQRISAADVAQDREQPGLLAGSEACRMT